MSTFIAALPQSAPKVSALQLTAVLKVWTARARGRAALDQMTDAQLSDVGLSRADAATEAQKWMWQA